MRRRYNTITNEVEEKSDSNVKRIDKYNSWYHGGGLDLQSALCCSYISTQVDQYIDLQPLCNLPAKYKLLEANTLVPSDRVRAQ